MQTPRPNPDLSRPFVRRPRRRLLALVLTLLAPAAPAAAQAPPPQAPAAQDDAQRYVLQSDIAVRTADGGTVCVMVMRPRASPPLPALLLFTIYNDPAALMREVRRSAAHGYAGVVGLTRGKGCSPERPIPYEHDGADADAVIDWIAAQPWSDGRVGMYGGSYSGFTPWAALKHRPAALRAIMVGATNGPGVDTPTENGVAWNFIYPWPFYTTDNKTLDDVTYSDSARWAKLNRDWYVSGRAYRDLDRIDGTPNPLFDRWLEHPTYDAFWQAMVPYKDEFAAIDIPVLQTAGYYYGGPAATAYFFTQHYKYNPAARHYLVVGPYDHLMAQRGAAAGHSDVVAGYQLDPAALIDLVDLRYRWFDYIFKGGPRPAILADKVNYEVTGANVWKHAPSLEAMGKGRLRLYLSGRKVATAYRLTDHDAGAAAGAHTTLTVDLADRRDVDANPPGGQVRDRALDLSNGLEFIGDPLATATEISGLFSGRLQFAINKRDFDFEIDLYELTAGGDYMLLAPYQTRASQAADPTRRDLLTPGRRTDIAFRAMRLMSRRLAAGSRVVAVVRVIKNAGQQINYGSGKPVSEETTADAGAPLVVKWFTGSYLDLPVASGAGARS